MKTSFKPSQYKIDSINAMLTGKVDYNKTLIDRGRQGIYKSLLMSFAKHNIDDIRFNEFQKIVKSYQKVNKIKIHPLNEYSDFSTMIRQYNQLIYLDNPAFKKQKAPLNRSKSEKDIRRAYVAYWTDQIIQSHNIKLKISKELYEKHNPEKSFVYKNIDIRKITGVSEGKIHTALIDLNALDTAISHFDLLNVRSNPSLYEPIKKLPKNSYSDIFENDKIYKLTHFKNEYLLWLNNFVYSARRAGWSKSTLELIEDLSKSGKITEMYKVFKDENIEFVFKYKTMFGDNEVTNEEDRFVAAIKKL